MEITQYQFTANLQQMPEESQVQVVQLIENNEPPVLQAFAMSLGVTLSMGEEPAPQEPAPEPMPQEPAPEPMSQEPVPEPMPETPPMQDQMQQLAMGDQVAGMIDQPGAEDETGVADDVPMNVREGAFIINAAALAKVGRKDFEERIIEPAIEYLKEKDGIEIDKAAITKPAQQVNGDQKILASNKEYHIPPELAEVIGTDLLEKINNSGKPETEKKLKEQEQQPQQKQEVPVRAANGLQVEDVPRPKMKPKKKVDPKEEAKRKLRVRENDPLEKGKQTTSIAKKLFEKEKFLTIGFGHRVVPKESAKLFEELFNVTAEQAKSIALGKTPITRDQALKLFDRDYKVKEDDVIRRVGGEEVYKNLPSAIQEVFVDANFRGDFQKNNKNYKWVQNTLDGDYAAASTEVLDHNELRANPKGGVAKRLRDYSATLASFAVPKRLEVDEEAAVSTQEMQNSFMEQRPPIISDAELTALEQGSDINTYSISEPEEDVKPFDPVQNRRQRRRQRRLKAATR